MRLPGRPAGRPGRRSRWRGRNAGAVDADQGGCRGLRRCAGGPGAALGIQQRACRTRWARQRSLWPGSLTTVPRPTPCRCRRCRDSVAPLGRVRPALQLRSSTEVGMDGPGRLFLCARCRAQVVLCSHCDRGNRYCGRQCRRLAREAARRESARRYQRSRRGRLAHAERSRRWRQRCRARGDGGDGGGGLQQNVTHQGCPPGVAAASLAAWTHHTTSAPEPAQTAAMAATTPIALATTTATLTAVAPWRCRRCARPQPGLVRQGYLRHGPRPVRPGWRHDHGP